LSLVSCFKLGHGKTRLSDEASEDKETISEKQACKYVFAACEEAVAVTESKLHAQCKLGSLRKFADALVLWNSNKKNWEYDVSGASVTLSVISIF
jgi:hypothetical protein